MTITSTEGKFILSRLHPHAESGLAFVYQHDLNARRIEPYKLLDEPFYAGTDYALHPQGHRVLVHLIDEEKLKQFIPLSWNDKERQRRDAMAAKEVGG